MKYKMYITHRNKDMSIIKFEVSELVSQIEHFTSILGQPGKLTFILEKDPNDWLKLSEGDLVEFQIQNENQLSKNIFKGYIFIIGTDSTEAYKVTAYDQTRYLKNHDTMAVENMTINQLFDDICTRNTILRKASLYMNPYILPNKLYNDKSFFDILSEAFDDILVNSSDHSYFFIKDNYGVLELNELKNCKTPYIIGDNSMLTDYQYESTIDEDTFTEVKIIAPNIAGQKSIEGFNSDKLNSVRYGTLKKIIELPEKTDSIKIAKYIDSFLSLHKNPKKTIHLSAIGIPELNAGNGFLLKLDKLELKKWMWITSAIHHYDSDIHTMDLEVCSL